MRLISITLAGQYKGLKDQSFDFSQTTDNVYALIGLNGSGKSQLLELISETFAYLERWYREEFLAKKGMGFGVTVHYEWDFRYDPHPKVRPLEIPDDLHKVELSASIDPAGNVFASWYRRNDWIEFGDKSKIPIPRVVGYASGLNENLQRSFMKNAVQQFEVRRISAKRQKEISADIDEQMRADINEYYVNKHPHIFSAPSGAAFEQGGYIDIIEVNSPASNFVYLDYDNAGLLILSLSVLQPDTVSEIFQALAFKLPSKAILQYDFHSGITEQDAIRDVQLLIRIAGDNNVSPIGKKSSEEQFESYGLDFLSGEIRLDLQDPELLEKLRDANYGNPLTLFLRFFKLQQLGVKNWPGPTRKKLLNDTFLGTVKKPLKTRLPFNVSSLILTDGNGREVCFDDLSDGEAQLMQVLAAAMVFGRSQSLMLFDEPETHLNPSWRTYFHHHLTKAILETDEHEKLPQLFLSTHSPFMVSSLKQENVFFFERAEDNLISMEPASCQTYGASFDLLIKNFYGLRSLMSQTVVKEVRKQLPKDDNAQGVAFARQWIEENLGDSMEKAYLLRKLQN
ncbi:AAA family ATPase [Marinobacter salicampi]|uniref:AAA family ATPase n=1 Tax=Marinobacter salicampi TaxID=435907 RepID=UPI00140BFD1B|nr:AAA family ATPase [Marinobacter salicampi]